MSKLTKFYIESLVARKTDLELSDFRLIEKENLLTVTPEMVAELFGFMTSKEQAQFFNHVDEVCTSWHGGIGALSIQAQYITDEDDLSLSGRRVMQKIGEYSHWGLVPQASSYE